MIREDELECLRLPASRQMIRATSCSLQVPSAEGGVSEDAQATRVLGCLKCFGSFIATYTGFQLEMQFSRLEVIMGHSHKVISVSSGCVYGILKFEGLRF